MTTPVFPEHDFALLPTQNEAIEGFYDLMAELRATRPVAPIRFHGRIAWVLTRHADVVAGFRDEAFFSARAVQEANTFPVMGRNIMGMEGEEHRIKRALVSPYFRRKLMPDFMDAMLRPLCHELIDGFAGRGRADLVSEFDKQLPLAVICRMLGIPNDDAESLKRWAMALISYPWDPEGALLASKEFTAYLRPVLADRRCAPRDDLLSALAVAEVEGQRLDDEEIFSFVRMLFPAGADTTYLAIGSMLFGLLTHPEMLEAVRKDPSLRDAAVDETLRWEGPTVLLPRMTTSGGAFGGETIPPHTVVLLGIGPANRDPAVFPDPDRFDVTRKTAGHIAFGHGNHFCLGSHLARAEMGVALDVLLERLPEIELEEPPRIVGAVMRGPEELRVRFRATH